MHALVINNVDDFNKHFDLMKRKVHIQVDASKYRGGKHRLEGRSLRVGSVDADGYWLRNDPNVCIPFDKAIVMQGLRPKLDSASVFVRLAKNAHVIAGDNVPQIGDAAVPVREVVYNNDDPYVILDLDGVVNAAGRPVRYEMAAALFVWEFKPFSFDIPFYTRKYGKEMVDALNFNFPCYKQSIVEGVSATMLILQNQIEVASIKTDGFSVGVIKNNVLTYLNGKVANFDSIEAAKAAAAGAKG